MNRIERGIYVMICDKCGCIFTYEFKDIIVTDILNVVECPKCHNRIDHDNREVLKDE